MGPKYHGQYLELLVLNLRKEWNSFIYILSCAKLMFCTAEVVEDGSEPHFCSPTLELARNPLKPL